MLRVFLLVFLPMFAVSALAAATPGPPGNAVEQVPTSDMTTNWNNWLNVGEIIMSVLPRQAGQAYAQKDYRGALPMYELLHQIQPDDPEVTKRLAYTLKENGRYEEAHDLLFPLTVEYPNDATSWWWLGDTQRLLGDYAGAHESIQVARDAATLTEKASYDQFLAFTETLGTSVPSVETFNAHHEFAERHLRGRRERRAIAEFMTALELLPEASKQEEGLANVGVVNNQIGIAYNQLKDPDAALDHFLRAAPLLKQAKNAEFMASCNQNLGITYRLLAGLHPERRNEYLEAGAKYWQEALKVSEESKNLEYIRYTRAGALLSLSAARAADDADVKALREANMKEVPWSGPVNEYTVAQACLAEFYCRLREGDFAGARVMGELAAPFYAQSKFTLDVEESLRLRIDLAHLHTEQDHPDTALTEVDLAGAKLSEVRTYMDAEAFARSLNAVVRGDIATAAARALVLKGDMEGAQRVANAAQVQASEDLVAGKVIDQHGALDYVTEKELIARRQKGLQADLEAAKKANATAEIARLEARLAQDAQRAAQLEKGVFPSPADAVSYRPMPPLGPAEFSAGWPTDTQLVSVLTDEYGSVALVFDGKTSSGTVLPGVSREVLRGLAEKAAAATTEAAQSLDEMSGKILAPILDKITAKTLYFAVDGPLAGIPMEMLRAGGAPLLAKHDIAYVPSASHLLRLATTTRGGGKGLRVVEVGAKDLAGLAGGAAGCVTEVCVAHPTEAVAAMVVHAPGNLKTADPMLVALELQPEGTYDGTLYATNLLGAQVKCDAVWLYLHGDGVVQNLAAVSALEEGFRHAGAHAVLLGAGPGPDKLAQDLLAKAAAQQLTLAAVSAAKREALAAQPNDATAATLRVWGVLD